MRKHKIKIQFRIRANEFTWQIRAVRIFRKASNFEVSNCKFNSETEFLGFKILNFKKLRLNFRVLLILEFKLG